MKSTTHPIHGTVTLNGQRVAYTADVERGEDGAMWVSDWWPILPPGCFLTAPEVLGLRKLILEDALYTATH